MILPGGLSSWPVVAAADDEQVRRAVEEVFADPAYREVTQPVVIGRSFVDVLRAIGAKIAGWLRSLGDWSVDLHGTSPFIFWLIVGILLVILVALIVHLVYSARFIFTSVGRSAREPEEAEREVRKARYRDLLGRARSLAAEGDYAEGIRTLLLALLARVGQRRPGLLLDGWTNHEVAARIPIDEVGRGRLHELAAIVDRVWYGRGTASADDFRNAAGIVESVARG